jgi:hypothetical protein
MKLLRYIVIVLFSLIWIAGCNSDVLSFLYKKQIIPDDYQYGDLYRLANLPFFKEKLTPCEAPQLNFVNPTSKKVHLYLIGDSFAEEQRLNQQSFLADEYHYIHWSKVLHVNPDTNAINIVLIESVERRLREHLASPITNLVSDTATFFVSPAPLRRMAKIDQAFSSEKTEERLATVLFEYKPMLFFKELKAYFNWKFFDRVSDKVTVNSEGTALVYYLDTDSTLVTSSFHPVADQEISNMVEHLNSTQEQLLEQGFDKVFLAIIPNKTTIVMPDYGTYNHLITKVQSHPSLKVTSIDILQNFTQLGERAYLTSDSHWTCEGQNTWLEKVNRQFSDYLQSL